MHYKAEKRKWSDTSNVSRGGGREGASIKRSKYTEVIDDLGKSSFGGVEETEN